MSKLSMSRLLVAIGNTHIKAAISDGQHLSQIWQVEHQNLEELCQSLEKQKFEQVAIASVVPDLITPWHLLPETRLIRLEQIPLKNTYPSLGIDRALVAWGASRIYGFPVLAIDLGTAISITGIDGDRAFAGGAILPGLKAQLNSLSQAASLPLVDLNLADSFPKWAHNTTGAIQSGVVYGTVAAIEKFMQNWQQLYPTSKIVLTGGDRLFIWQFLNPTWRSTLIHDANLIFLGMQEVKRAEN
jgi:type III pantothenate kinase